MEGRDHFEDWSRDGNEILKWILNNWDVMM
jgi:hypothetical protein